MAPLDPHDTFPCSLTIHIPFPNNRLASAAIGTLAVDQELSPLVQRSFSLVRAPPDSNTAAYGDPFKASLLVNAAPVQAIQSLEIRDQMRASGHGSTEPTSDDSEKTVLKTQYRATTNRMLRVAVNGFFESLGTIIQVMEELDTNVLHEKGYETLEGVQGIEQGSTE